MPEFTKRQIEDAKKIDQLMKEVFGEDYWKPQAGDWAFVKHKQEFQGAFLIDGMSENNQGLNLHSRMIGRSICAEFCFPIPTWSDCRAVLREMGIGLKCDMGVRWITICAYRRGPAPLQVPGMRRAVTHEITELYSAMGPDDLTAIMQVLLEALKRKEKEREDESPM